MDGNQRWSKINNYSLKKGYIKGLEKISEVCNICLDNKIKNLTLFALSTENKKRPTINIIFQTLLNQYNKMFDEYNFKKKIKVKIIGERKDLPKKIIKVLETVELETKNNNFLNLNIAFNYGTSNELVSIFNQLFKTKNLDKKNINYKMIKSKMYLSESSDPDILIRTGGYQRLSNFILLNLSYTEIYFIKTLWPDISKKIINNIIKKYHQTDRKYGL